jgi:uncharacterized membrane protein
MTDLDSLIRKKFDKANRGAHLWSLAYHGSAILAILCSGVVAVLAASERDGLLPHHAIWAALLSFVAAAAVSISTTAGFAQKWRANRATRTALEELRIDLSAAGADEAAVRERYKAVIRMHDHGIGGDDLG